MKATIKVSLDVISPENAKKIASLFKSLADKLNEEDLIKLQIFIEQNPNSLKVLMQKLNLIKKFL